MRSLSTRHIRQAAGWFLVLVLGAVSGIVLRPAGPVRPLGGESPVAQAAKDDDLATVRRLIEGRADVNVHGRDGSSALLWAAYHADLPMARTLINAGAAVDAANRYGVTPLLQASRTGDAPVMAALLEAGADPMLAHREGETPLMAASRSGQVEAVRVLLSRGADVNASDAFQKQTPLMWAVAEGHRDVVEVLLKAGANPNHRARITSLTRRSNADFPSGGFTALMWAARNGHEDVAKRLITGGANPNLTNGDGATAMTIAIVNDRFDLAAMLLELGADANDGSLYHAVEMRDATTDMYALDGSRLRANHPNKLTSLDLVTRLLHRGADPNKPFIGQLHSMSLCCGDYANASPFYRAALAADVEALQLMIERGANLEWSPSRIQSDGADGSIGTLSGANDNVGRAPIMVAMHGGRGAPIANGPGVHQREGPAPFREPSNREPLSALMLLLRAGANPDAVGPDGSTALHDAVKSDQLDMIRALADAGAALDRRNKKGLTALDLAGDKQPVAALLRELMSKPPVTVASAALAHTRAPGGK